MRPNHTCEGWCFTVFQKGGRMFKNFKLMRQSTSCADVTAPFRSLSVVQPQRSHDEQSKRSPAWRPEVYNRRSSVST